MNSPITATSTKGRKKPSSKILGARMAQQRILRPQDFADERFAGVSGEVHRLYLALRVLADDRGVCRYKKAVWQQHWPLLKQPRVHAAVLVSIGAIAEYEIEGATYWAIKDFARTFAVSRPGFRHPLPDVLWEFVGWTKEKQAAATDRTGEKRGRGGAATLALDLPDPPKPNSPAAAAPCSPDHVSVPPKPYPGKSGMPTEYKFRGAFVRLIAKDYDKWKIEFSKIPDFDAALRACDDWISGTLKGNDKHAWFFPARQFMAKKHQEWAARPSPGRPSAQHPNSNAAIMRRLAAQRAVNGRGPVSS